MHVLLLNDCVVCVHKSKKEAHIHATSLVSKSQREKERYRDTERWASILVLPHAGEIDGCIQDFYTPLIGFTGH